MPLVSKHHKEQSDYDDKKKLVMQTQMHILRIFGFSNYVNQQILKTIKIEHVVELICAK